MGQRFDSSGDVEDQGSGLVPDHVHFPAVLDRWLQCWAIRFNPLNRRKACFVTNSLPPRILDVDVGIPLPSNCCPTVYLTDQAAHEASSTSPILAHVTISELSKPTAYPSDTGSTALRVRVFALPSLKRERHRACYLRCPQDGTFCLLAVSPVNLAILALLPPPSDCLGTLHREPMPCQPLFIRASHGWRVTHISLTSLRTDSQRPKMPSYVFRQLTLVALALFSPGPGCSAQVKLGSTTLTGVALPESHAEFFGGIPYAEPPVGNLRLARPVAKFSLGNSTATFDATQFGDSCPQPPSPFTPANLSMSEDCLNINVFRPAGMAPGTSVPVMVWIYGGSFFTGTAEAFNGSSLVARSVARGTPVIYVSFNYRLGPLGFPQGPEATSKGVLNLGLRDQVLALQWVQANIRAFGGDKTKVTVFGQSAGAVSISLLWLNDIFPTLARAAIFESGEAGTTGIFDANKSLPQWSVFVNSTPTCGPEASIHDAFTCLRAATSDQLLAAGLAGLGAMVGEFPFFPVLDGPAGLIPALPSKLLRSGAGNNVPFLSGSVLDDGTLFVALSSAINATSQITDQLNSSFFPCATQPTLRNTLGTLLELYPDVPALGCPFNTGNDTFGISPVFKQAAALIGDLVIQAPRRFWSQTASEKGTNVYSYLFTDPQPQNPPFLGVAHLSEIPYVYGDVSVAANGAGPKALSVAMQDYWISFAVSLTPNDGKGVARPNWEAYSVNQRVLQLNSTNTGMIADDFRRDQMVYLIENAALFCQ